MKNLLAIAVFLFGYLVSFSQEKINSRKSQWMDLAATIGKSQGAAAVSYVYTWKTGKRKRLEAGLGARFTSAFGEKLEYTTAPAKLSRTNTTPFLIFFAGQKTENWDTLLVERAAISGRLVLSEFTRNAIAKFKTK